MRILRNYTFRLRDSSYSEIDNASMFNAQKMIALKCIKGHCSLSMPPENRTCFLVFPGPWKTSIGLKRNKVKNVGSVSGSNSLTLHILGHSWNIYLRSSNPGLELEWLHQNNRCALSARSTPFPYQRMYVMDGWPLKFQELY